MSQTQELKLNLFRIHADRDRRIKINREGENQMARGTTQALLQEIKADQAIAHSAVRKK